MENECLIQKNELIPMDNIYNICKSTVQIKYQYGNEEHISSGFFIKFQKNNKPFLCLMTNDHCITNSTIVNEEEIKILYENKKKELKIKLDPKERLMKSFKEDFSLDITIIQIIEKDQIDDDYFLLPDLSYLNKYDFLVGEEIEIPQFPLGGKLQISHGEIIEINYEKNKYQFTHTASTLKGSSGSPIILKDKESVIGIHKAGKISKEVNYGDLIGPIINIINTLKRNGKGKEYYKNKKIKYEGNFVDDEYDGDDGCFYYENGDIYIGQFKNGKKNGSGFIYDKDNNLKIEGEFLDDKLIYKKSSDSDNNDNNNDNSEENDNNKKDKQDLNENKSNDDEGNKESNDEKESHDSNNSNNNDEEEKDNSKEEENKEDLKNEVFNNINSDNIIDNNNINNNPNNNDNNNVNNNNSNNDKKNNFYTIKTQMFHIFHPLGNMLGMICTRCSHLTSRHKTIGFGKWKCEECREDDNICSSREDAI